MSTTVEVNGAETVSAIGFVSQTCRVLNRRTSFFSLQTRLADSMFLTADIHLLLNLTQAAAVDAVDAADEEYAVMRPPIDMPWSSIADQVRNKYLVESEFLAKDFCTDPDIFFLPLP